MPATAVVVSVAGATRVIAPGLLLLELLLLGDDE